MKRMRSVDYPGGQMAQRGCLSRARRLVLLQADDVGGGLNAAGENHKCAVQQCLGDQSF